MADYDLNAVAEAAVENALQLLPPVDKLMKLTYHDMLKLIIRAAAPTIEEAYYQWLLVELSEAGIMVDLDKLRAHFDGSEAPHGKDSAQSIEGDVHHSRQAPIAEGSVGLHGLDPSAPFDGSVSG